MQHNCFCSAWRCKRSDYLTMKTLLLIWNLFFFIVWWVMVSWIITDNPHVLNTYCLHSIRVTHDHITTGVRHHTESICVCYLKCYIFHSFTAHPQHSWSHQHFFHLCKSCFLLLLCVCVFGCCRLLYFIVLIIYTVYSSSSLIIRNPSCYTFFLYAYTIFSFIFLCSFCLVSLYFFTVCAFFFLCVCVCVFIFPFCFLLTLPWLHWALWRTT